MASLSVTNQKEKKSILENVVQAATVYVVLLAVFSAWESVFEIQISMSQMVVALGGSTLFLLLLMWNREYRIRRMSIGAILLIILGVVLRKSLYSGIISYVNQFVRLYNQFYNNRKTIIDVETIEYSSVVALFFLGILLGLFLHLVLDWKKGVILSILIIALPVIFSAIVGKMPLSINWWFLIAATCLYLLVYRGQNSLISVKGVSLTTCVLAVIIVISTIIQPMILDYKNMHLEEYNQIRNDFIYSQETGRLDWQEKVSNLKNKPDNFAGGISKGELSKNASVNPTGEVAMEIVMTEQPTDTIYLKAYVASEYTGDSWKEISSGELSDILPRIGGSGKQRELLNEPFRRVAEGDYDEFLGELEVPQITIELVNASKEFGYAPYCAEITDEHSIYKDSYVQGDFTKTRKYTFYPLSFEGNTYQNYLLNYVYQNVITSPSYFSYGFSEFFDMSLGEESELWKAYCDFVKEAYVDNHQELKHLRSYCDSIDRTNVEGALLNYFDSKCYYSKNPGEMPADMDFAEGFMFGRKVGFCVHFATAATLVYQMCGQPARYVEGYAVSPSEFMRYEDGTYRATVTDESAHAWCEVFDEEIGWVAKEFTPSSGFVIENWEEEDTSDFEEELLEEQIPEEESQIPEENEENPQENENHVDNSEENDPHGGLIEDATSENQIQDGFAGKAMKQIMFRIVAIAGGIFVIALVIVAQQRIRRTKRLNSFRKKKENKGVLSIYNAIFELCIFAGFKTDKERERDKMQEVAKQFPQLTEAEWNQLYLWAEKAAFANCVISKEEQKEIYHLYRRLRTEILKTLDFKKKIWFLYVRAM